VRGTTRKGRIRVSTKAGDGWVEVAISDTGRGIAEDIKARIFEPFFTTKGPLKGSGQGLSLAKTLVEKHGGSIRFESVPGEGTTFFVRIPVKAVEAEASAETAAAAHPA
jgi:signal transduction histidine kinase